MADDDGGDWFSGGADEPEPAPAVSKKEAAAAPAAKGEAAAAAGDQPEEVEETRPEADVEPIDPDKLVLCKHWIRPRFLQYRYLYDYRHNYYNDVIDYLDKRQKGVSRDIPRAETWAERSLRTYNSKLCRAKYFNIKHEDTKLCTQIRLGSLFHIYHSKEYFNRRYATLI